MKKIFLVFVLLILIGFISGCKTTTPGGEETTTTVDTGLDDISGDINDINDASSEDYDIDDIDVEDDMPPI